jgi:hypothetical protein
MLALIVWAASRSVGYAFDGALNASLFPPSQTDGIQENNRTLIITFSKNLDLAFQKTLNDKHPLLSLYYRDLSTNAGSTYAMSDIERNSESRLLTRQALARALQDTVNDVNLLYTVKEYGRAMTSAHLKVKDGNMSLEGPSLDNVGNHSDPSPREGLRSSLLLINNAHFGLTFRTTFGSIQSNLTYFLAGHDLLGASLEKDLSKQTKLILEYRLAPDENRALVSLQLPLEY